MLKTTLALLAAVLLAPLVVVCQFVPANSAQLLPGKSDTGPDKPGKVTVLVKNAKDMGRGGDTELAHVNPAEKKMLKKMGGSGTVNPKTGLREYKFGGGGHGASADSRSADRGRDRGNRDDDRLAGPSGFGTLEGARSRARSRSREAQKEIDRTFGGDDGRVAIERRKKATNFKDISGREDQRDGALLLEVTVGAGDRSGELGDGESAPTAKGKGDDKRRGRAATLLSGSEGIRDKLGRSGRRSVGKSLG